MKQKQKIHGNKIKWSSPAYREKMIRSFEKRNKIPVIDRFLNKIEKTDTCWNWIAAKYGSGYGVFDKTGAHRFSYSYFISKIPKGMVIMHKCDNKLCVNPGHLSIGTQKDNLHDMYRKGRNRKKETYKSGGQHFNAKLTNDEADEMRILYSTGNFSWLDLAKIYNISKRCAGSIVRNETYAQ